MSSPSTKMVPVSGFSRPIRCFMITDLPWPELPMMTLILPRAMSRSTPRKTMGAEGLIQTAQPDVPVPAALADIVLLVRHPRHRRSVVPSLAPSSGCSC